MANGKRGSYLRGWDLAVGLLDVCWGEAKKGHPGIHCDDEDLRYPQKGSCKAVTRARSEKKLRNSLELKTGTAGAPPRKPDPSDTSGAGADRAGRQIWGRGRRAGVIDL